MSEQTKDKFENIKPGDTVMAPIRVRGGSTYYSYRDFYIPKVVTRVTKTQLVVEAEGSEEKYLKSTGRSSKNEHGQSQKFVKLLIEIESQDEEMEVFVSHRRSVENMKAAIGRAYQYSNHLSDDVPPDLANEITLLLSKLFNYKK